MSPARETPDVPLEQRLRESEARFQVMADCAPVLLWMAGTDARCDFFNKTWLDFTGRSLEQEAGYGWAEGIHPEDVQTCMDTYLDAFNARRPFMMEYRLRRADGAFRWVLDTGTPRFSPTGEFLGFIGSCVDITDRKGLEGEIRALNRDLERRVQDRTQDLEEANRNLESFSVSVSHDLRAPLRRIVMAAMFQAADEMRRIQRLAYRTVQLRGVRPSFGDGARDAWERDPAWQPLREAVERLLTAYDWGEAFVALNLVLKPAVDALFLGDLGRAAGRRGDRVLAGMLDLFAGDAAWQASWSRSLVEAALADRPANREPIDRWTAAWTPRAQRAAAALAPLFRV